MKVAVLGVGMVGLAVSARLAELGHDVTIGTRDPRRSADKLAAKHEKVQVGTLAEAAAAGEMIFNATNGAGSLEALQAAGEINLNGKVLVDIANPLDFSKGMPPSLLVSNTDSLGEQIQRMYPQVKVVKALNTVTAAIMANPAMIGDGDHELLMCGNDAQAKEAVKSLLGEFGWSHFLDLGDISAARGMEMYLPLWLRLWGALGTGMFNMKIVR